MTVKSMQELQKFLKGYEMGETIELLVQRQEEGRYKEQQIQITLQDCRKVKDNRRNRITGSSPGKQHLPEEKTVIPGVFREMASHGEECGKEKRQWTIRIWKTR